MEPIPLDDPKNIWASSVKCHGNQTFRTIDYSYHRRFVPWIFRTLRTTDYSYHSRTFRTIAEQ